MNETDDRGRLCRALMRRQSHAVLATSLAEGDRPRAYASLVALACDHDASPLLLLSALAQHTRNIAADPRVSLLFDGAAAAARSEPASDPLAEPRVSVIGCAAPVDDARLLARFTARHPGATQYAGFGDFRLYRVAVERGHLVAGFGRIAWVEAAQLVLPGAAATLAAAEGEIVAHMNADHAEAVGLYAARLLRRGGEGWRMCGIDPEGIDLRHGAETARLDFADHALAPVRDPAAARQALVALAQQARAAPLP